MDSYQRMKNIDRAESAAFNADLDSYYAAENAAEARRVAIDDLIAYKTEEYLNDQTKFDWLDDNFEIVDRGQVMRALRSNDKAIISFNLMVNALIETGVDEKALEQFLKHRASTDVVFTALSNIQANFNKAIEHEAIEEYDGSVK